MDFRSDPMESREGKGLARRAWSAYTRAVTPYLEPVARRLSATMATDLVGFWLVWHLQGGFEGLERLGVNRATIYRKISRFRRAFGQHPDEFKMPGVTIDVAEYRAAGGSLKGRK